MYVISGPRCEEERCFLYALFPLLLSAFIVRWKHRHCWSLKMARAWGSWIATQSSHLVARTTIDGRFMIGKENPIVSKFQNSGKLILRAVKGNPFIVHKYLLSTLSVSGTVCAVFCGWFEIKWINVKENIKLMLVLVACRYVGQQWYMYHTISGT